MVSRASPKPNVTNRNSRVRYRTDFVVIPEFETSFAEAVDVTSRILFRSIRYPRADRIFPVKTGPNCAAKKTGMVFRTQVEHLIAGSREIAKLHVSRHAETGGLDDRT